VEKVTEKYNDGNAKFKELFVTMGKIFDVKIILLGLDSEDKKLFQINITENHE